LFQRYQTEKSPASLRAVVDDLSPVITRAVDAYVPNASPVIRSRARLLAANAISKFDPSRGASLATHVHRQLQELQRIAPQLSSPLPMSQSLRRDRGAVLRATAEATNDLGREPSDEEVADRLHLSTKRVTKVRSQARTMLPQSMLEEVEDDDDKAEIIASKRSPEDDWMDAVYHDLGDIDRVILQGRTGYRSAAMRSNQDLARALNLSPAAVSTRAARIQARLDSFRG
jgi:DNA-directed RNA polymerase specialized sigma subunit